MTLSVAAVPGFAGVPDEGKNAFAEMAVRRHWDLDGLAAAISHESGWNPAAINPTPPGAVGILQWIPTTLARYGTNSLHVRKLSVAQQMPYVERFFDEWEALGYGIGPRDFLAFGLGVARARHAPGGIIVDEEILYPAGSAGALGNSILCDPDGAIRMGTMRRRLDRIVAAAATRPRVEIPLSVPPKERLARLGRVA